MTRVDRVLVGLLLSWGLVWSGETGAAPLPARKQPEPAREDEGESGEPRYEFNLNGKPWREVFVWLSEKSGGLPVVGIEVPKGTFSVTLAPGKKYTIDEVVVIINAALSRDADGWKYLLIRRPGRFVLLWTRELLPNDLAREMRSLPDAPSFDSSFNQTVTRNPTAG
jgi:hypothetical protein